MNTQTTTPVAVIGGGVVGSALAAVLAHRGVGTVVLESESGLALAASGTNSGIVHTGFDSTPGELETAMITRSAPLRERVLETMDIPFLRVGALLRPYSDEDRATIRAIAENAAKNNVHTSIRPSDGALEVPGEAITDPVAFASALARSAQQGGAEVRTGAPVVGIDREQSALRLHLADGASLRARLVLNAAGLHADDIARMVGDDSFEIYPRKGEFYVFELPGGERLEKILLPVPTKRTKGVLVFPTIDGKVVAGPTAHDQTDKDDWRVRPESASEVLEQAVRQFPQLDGLEPIATYAGLRPAGRNANYIIGPSRADARLINVAAIRSTGLTAALGIAEYVAGFLPSYGLGLGTPAPAAPVSVARSSVGPWWRRTAEHRRQGIAR